MLSTTYKARILRRAGVWVPPSPLPCTLTRGEGHDDFAQWEATIHALFNDYAIERAAKSLGIEEQSQYVPLRPSHRAGGTHQPGAPVQ